MHAATRSTRAAGGAPFHPDINETRDTGRSGGYTSGTTSRDRKYNEATITLRIGAAD
jgi:hypothetical protein